MKRRPLSTQERLRIARAQLRAIDKLVSQIGSPARGRVTQSDRSAPERFTQIISVGRGYASVLHALDTEGRVWERHVVLGPAEQGKPKPIVDQWWEKIGMERR